MDRKPKGKKEKGKVVRDGKLEFMIRTIRRFRGRISDLRSGKIKMEDHPLFVTYGDDLLCSLKNICDDLVREYNDAYSRAVSDENCPEKKWLVHTPFPLYGAVWCGLD